VPPDNTTDSNLPDMVSREAHQRMTDERNQLKARVSELEATVLDFGLADKARRHFQAKHVEDPDWAAEIALPTIRQNAGEIEDIGSFLDQKFARLYPSGDIPSPSTPPADTTPMPDAVQPPGFARPSPSGEGQPPGQKKYRTTDPEIRALIAANDKAAIERLDREGLIEWRTAAPVTPG